jgi:hypothetical protein
MRFEEQVTGLCAQALAAEDDAKARELLGELRTVLHQRIEKLRNGLFAAYPPQVHPASINDALRPLAAPTRITAQAPRTHVKAPKRWQQVVHAISGETDAGTALRLSLELTGLLQLRTETKSQS